MSWAVRFDNVSKRYPGNNWGYPSLRGDLSRLGRSAAAWLTRRRTEPEGPIALQDISFEVKEGESFALIGPNGAGKTTTLKMLTRISFPSQGRIHVRGRIGALIEVGSGIHPELTGRENIWLYGRIMGMSKPDIARRFDEIVEFAELGHVLDRPVKRYSSGMQLRLGFSIASHIDPDIFVVDEALAVGDAGFQSKCVERMMRLVTEGRTLLFVSHHLQAVEAICKRGIFLLNGRIEAAGSVPDILKSYIAWIDNRQQERWSKIGADNPSGQIVIDRITFHDASGAERTAFRTGEDIEVRLAVRSSRPIVRPNFAVGIGDGRPGALIVCSMAVDGQVPEVIDGPSVVSCRMRGLPLMPRVYQAWCGVRGTHGYGFLLGWQMVGTFRVTEGPTNMTGVSAVSNLSTDAPIHVDHDWDVATGANAMAPALGVEERTR
ncbi:MAG TPA: ABC transporter ATP-binding protein [bacterium]|nr:ABC transporter ATP-binding protein [bacterium]